MTMASDQQGTWQLKMIHGSVPGQSFRIERDAISIGRDAGNDVTLDEPSVSRWHAQLVYRDGWFYIQDLGSASGIVVNGSRIQGSMRIGPGDRIALSRDVTLALEWVPANEQTAIMGDTSPTPPRGTQAPLYDAPTQQWQPSPPTQPPSFTERSASGPPPAPPPQQEQARGFPWLTVGLAGCGGMLLVLAVVGIVGALIYSGLMPTPFRTAPGEPTVVLTLTLPGATPLATFAPTATAVPTTQATSTLPPAATTTPVPTHSPTPTESAAATAGPTATTEATATPEPTQTPVPTATAVPPTATPVPPTATLVPPTATAVPPTATPVPTATTPPTPLSLGHSVDDVACISKGQYRIKFTVYMGGGTGEYFVYRDIESQPVYGPGPATSAPYELVWGAGSSAVGTFFVRSGGETEEDKFYVQTPDCSGF